MSTPLLGLAFPFRIAASGPGDTARLAGVARSVGPDKLRDDVRALLLTRTGERVMRRDYGSRIERLRQEPNSTALRALVRHEIEQALRIHLPEVRITSPVQLAVDESQLTIAFEYAADPRDVVQRLEVVL